MSEYDVRFGDLSWPPPPFDASLEGSSGALVAQIGEEAKSPGAPLERGSDESTRAAPVPQPAVAAPNENSEVASGDEMPGDERSNNDVRHVVVIFRDALDLPIEHLEITIPLPDGSVFTSATTSHGAVTLPIPAGLSGSVPVKVKDVTGVVQPVCSLELGKCTDAVTIRSPKVVVSSQLRQHQQIPPPKPQVAKAPVAVSPAAKPHGTTPSLAWWSDNGALAHAWQWIKSEMGVAQTPPENPPESPILAKGLSPAGQPMMLIVGPECPNPLGLRLGRNNLFRDALVEASKRLGLVPQAICALIQCEAAKLTEKVPKLDVDGKPLKDKHGKALSVVLHERWDANSGNAESNAAGLTQFIRGTWLDHVLLPNYYIHARSQAEGWVRLVALPEKGSKWMFVLSDGTTVLRPMDHIGDAHVNACLAKRMDPTWSINAAADYGAANLKALDAAGFKLAGLPDMEKAKLMYLMHHEGVGAGPRFIQNTMAGTDEEKASLRKKFYAQFGKNGTQQVDERIANAGGDVESAYRAWLAAYINDKFEAADKFFCKTPLASRKMSPLIVAIGGKSVEKS